MSHAPRAWWLETKLYARILRASTALADSRGQNPKIFLTFSFSSAGGVGGADKKWKGNFWFCFAGSMLKLFNIFAIIVL